MQILDILRDGEQCVCHIEAVLGLRPAYLSQQLMALRKAGLVADRKDGWRVYYRITDRDDDIQVYLARDIGESLPPETEKLLIAIQHPLEQSARIPRRLRNGLQRAKRGDTQAQTNERRTTTKEREEIMKMFKEGGRLLFDQAPEASRVVSEMLLDLEKNGLDAVRKYSKKFDDWDPPAFELSERQIAEAIGKLDPQIIQDTDFCQDNVRRFAQAQLKTLQPLEVEIRPGVILGHKHIPVKSVGSYIPGGRYPMFGSAQMSIIPAKVAGVDRVYAFTPPVKGEGYYPATINAMKKAGADRIFIVGGVPAFAMMAFGMGVFEPVDILCGAGNKYVAEAKRQLFGRCGIDLLAGPTEILIIADDSADPALAACDLLGQAEHDPNSGIALVCFSEAFARHCCQELLKQLAVLPTRDVAELSWRDNGRIYVASNCDEAIAISDDYAPEHLELHVQNPDDYLDRLRNYGSLFIGEETTVAYGDKCIGTNHILPTSRSARYTGGVWVGKFLKTVTYQKLTSAASRLIGEVTERQCNVERMLAHGITARVRIERYEEVLPLTFCAPTRSCNRPDESKLPIDNK